jgi:hypothetical protein
MGFLSGGSRWEARLAAREIGIGQPDPVPAKCIVRAALCTNAVPAFVSSGAFYPFTASD